MDVIDLNFIGNPEDHYGYWISNDLAKNSTITIPKEQHVIKEATSVEIASLTSTIMKEE